MRGVGKVLVMGGGGHAKVVIRTLQMTGYEVAAVLDDDSSKWGNHILGHLISGPMESAATVKADFGVIAVGDNRLRQAIAGRIQLAWLTLVHPAANVDPSVHLGEGTVVFAGTVIQPDTSLGKHVIINTSATVDHDCRVADFAHIGPGSHVAGGVWVGFGAFLGIGSAVIPCIRIGSWATVGAGAVVVRHLPEGVTACGVPARPRLP